MQRSESIALSTFYSLVVRAESQGEMQHMSVISSLRLVDWNGCSLNPRTVCAFSSFHGMSKCL